MEDVINISILKDRNRKNFILQTLKGIEQLSTCLRRKVGAIIIDSKSFNIISYGYNGAPKKVRECLSLGCLRKKSKSGNNLNICRATHAEINAIINCSALGGKSTKGAILFCSAKPCINCLKSIINAEIQKIIFLEDYPIPENELELYIQLVQDSRIDIVKFKEN